jgi:hypothetical protein
MNDSRLYEILRQVANGDISPDSAAIELKSSPFTDLGFAKADNHRSLRQGVPEVIFGEGKSAQQIIAIIRALEGSNVLITRLSADKAEAVSREIPLNYDIAGRIAFTADFPPPDTPGTILIATGGTSDIPVAREAAFTAKSLGNPVTELYDVGVAGLHRLLAHMDEIMGASVIIAVAGMEGALASVIGGLADCPVIAVPTSVGYGTSFGGVSALLSMLNSCASGVSCVNIDNGFGAGYQAHLINHTGGKHENTVH